MPGNFYLKRVDIEDPADEDRMSGFGFLDFFQCEVEYHFSAQDMSLEEAELYIKHVLNCLPDNTINEICKRSYEWKTEKMSYDTAEYPAGLAEAEGKGILAFMSVADVELYRNPYDSNDKRLGAILGGGTEWDAENGMEIVILGDKVLEVREYLGYGEFAIWAETDENE